MLGELKQSYARRLTALEGLFIPDAGLDLADMGTAEHKHAEPRLTDTATDGRVYASPLYSPGATPISFSNAL